MPGADASDTSGSREIEPYFTQLDKLRVTYSKNRACRRMMRNSGLEQVSASLVKWLTSSGMVDMHQASILEP